MNQKFQRLNNSYNKLLGIKQNIEKNIEDKEVELELKQIEYKRTKHCIQLLDYISQNSQNKVISLFEHTISAGLKDLFDDSYEFKFDIKTRGSSSSCDFIMKNDTFPGWSSLIMCHGKSVQEIVSAILRIVLVKLDKNSRKIVVLDEPFSGLEIERQRSASKFLSDICDKFEIQLIVVTHSLELMESSKQEVNINAKERKRS